MPILDLSNVDNTYQLLIHLKKDSRITIGALGEHLFPAGYYVYTGSAKKNIAARIARHQRKEKPLRWHIDYLTTHAKATVVDTQTFCQEECKLNQSLEGDIVVARFGASDCRYGCGSHLKYVGKKRLFFRKQR
ncbi:DUF123 domain-containing protein [Pseudomonadota bacterium]